MSPRYDLGTKASRASAELSVLKEHADLELTHGLEEGEGRFDIYASAQIRLLKTREESLTAPGHIAIHISLTELDIQQVMGVGLLT